MTDIYSLTALETNSPKPRCRQALGKDPSSPIPSSGGSWRSLAVAVSLYIVSASVSACPLLWAVVPLTGPDPGAVCPGR